MDVNRAMPAAGLPESLALLFPSARPDSIDALANAALVSTYHRDEEIRPSSVTRPPVVVVLQGVVARRCRTADGREVVVGLIEPGSIGGLVAVRSESTISIEFIARTDAVAASWRPPAAQRLAQIDGGFALDLFDLVSRLAMEMTGTLMDRSFDSAEVRMARLMAERPDLLFDPLSPVIRRSELGKYIGTSREMAERIVRGLEERGIVRRTGPSGLVELDRAALRAELGSSSTTPEPRSPHGAGSGNA